MLNVYGAVPPETPGTTEIGVIATPTLLSGTSKLEKDENDKYIRRERYTGSCSRSFYIGDGYAQEDIHANFKDGVLTLSIPKKEVLPQKDETKYIAIEG